jgi:hypothetical protein
MVMTDLLLRIRNKEACLLGPFNFLLPGLPVGYRLRVIASARPKVELAVDQPAPLSLDVIGELFPVAFEAVPVHADVLAVVDSRPAAANEAKLRCEGFRVCSPAHPGAEEELPGDAGAEWTYAVIPVR